MERQVVSVPWCPGCLRPVGDAARCPACGLRQHGADAARLRVVVRRLHDLGEAQRALAAEAAALGLERRRLLGELAPPAPARATREWRPGVVRGLLLGLGALLVALAALIFSVVAWVRLGDLGRAGLLAGATLAAAAAAAAARRRLPATAEALGGLALALALVDWYAAWRAGAAGGWSATAWWALGSGAGAAVAAGAGRWLAWQRPAAALLLQVSAVLVVATVAEDPWTVAAGLALAATGAATACAALAPNRRWRPAALLLGGGAAVLELVALSVVPGWPAVDDLAGAAGPAAALAAVALAPAAARTTLARRGEPAGPVGSLLRHGLVAAAAGALLAAAAALLAAVWASWALLAAVAVLGAAVSGLARALPAALRRGTALAAAAALAAGVAGLLGPLLRALAVPVTLAGDPWSAALGDGAAGRLPGPAGWLEGAGAAVVALLAGAAAAALAGAPRPGPRLLAPRVSAGIAAAAGVGVLAALPPVAGWPLWAALLATGAAALAAGTGAVLTDRRPRPPAAGGVAAGCSAALLALAASWALATEAGTLAFLGVVAAAAAAGAAAARRPWLRGGLAATGAAAALGEAAAVVLGAGGDAAAAGAATTAAGGLVLLAGARWRPGSAEGAVLQPLGLAAQALGVALAAPDGRWLAVALTVAVPAHLLAGADPARRGHLWTGAATAVAATWAWLADAGVTLPEAYALPAAAAALAAGAAARRGRPRPGSWVAFGPGLAVALLPSLGVAVGGAGATARPLLLTAAALLVLLAGARARLQAPLVLGGATLLLLGVDAVAPVAAQLPRWLTIGAAGLLLLWLGATAERRLERLRRLRRRFHEA